jgi:NADH pyrophosphatase NudC (nudix superfamily)
MNTNRVRPIAICVIEHEGKILVHDGYDAVKQQRFGRPLGGSIEFGEPARQTIIREFQEALAELLQ